MLGTRSSLFHPIAIVADKCQSWGIGSSINDKCQWCPAGRIGARKITGWRSDQDYACVVCEPGKYRMAFLQVPECLDCEPGMYSTGGASQCSYCDNGRVTSVRGGGATGCTACPPGQQPAGGTRWCDSCANNMSGGGDNYFSQFGVTCVECPAPNVVNSARTSCSPPFTCPAGSSCPDGVECTAQAQCEQCAPGNFSLGVQPCAPCTEQGKVNNTQQSACETCEPGTEPNLQRSHCLVCSIDITDCDRRATAGSST